MRIQRILPLLPVCIFLSGTASADDPGIHGMLVVGNENIYISHLPLFSVSKHRYQGIWEVSFGADGDARYREDRRITPESQIYTLQPMEAFRLPELVQDRASFRADVFRGHFERNGQRLLESVPVTIKRVVHFHRFDGGDRRPSDLLYVSFGRGNERFLAHWISAPDNYDQILVIGLSQGGLPFDWLPEGTWVRFPGRNDTTEPLRSGEDSTGDALLKPDVSTPVELDVVRQYYLEVNELKAKPDPS